MSVKFEFSSGGVVVDKNKVLVIKTKNLKNETVFTFPKGHIEKGEKPETAALREVKEETGIIAEIICKVDDVEYWFMNKGEKIHKRVNWFLMKPKEILNTKSDEIDEVIWFDINEVDKILSYNSDKKLVEKVKKIIKEKKLFGG